MCVHRSKSRSLLLLILASVLTLIFSSIYLSRCTRRTAFTGTNQHRDEDEVLEKANTFWEEKEKSTQTAEVTTTKAALKTESDQRSETEPETPMPVLYKKDFKKLPRWDFEDVYNQDALPRTTTCAQSLRNSQDKSFREAFLPNIRLFLHKDNFNMSEWNRLSHFNNPFGFMEYEYDGGPPSVNVTVLNLELRRCHTRRLHSLRNRT